MYGKANNDKNPHTGVGLQHSHVQRNALFPQNSFPRYGEVTIFNHMINFHFSGYKFMGFLDTNGMSMLASRHCGWQLQYRKI